MFQVLVSPPLFRNRPLWYQQSLTQVAERFSAVLMTDHPPNFRLLPSFTHQVLDVDGVFLNPVSGLHYILHLFDSADFALKSAYLGADQQMLLVKESVRQSNDRVSYLENRHSGLQKQVDLKTASDAELADMMLNRSEEDWLSIAGLPRLQGDQWQDAARRQVADAIKLALRTNRININFEVMYVSNPFRYQTNRQNMYYVRMDSTASSKRIREVFSGFFRKNRPVPLPPALKGVSVRNKVTPDTKIRIAILHQLGSIYQESNRGSSYKVQGFDPRPLLITLPPNGSAGRQRTYNFIQAVNLLPATFSEEHLIRIYQVVSNQQQGKLRSLFVVLNDDERERCLELVKQQRASGRGPGSRPTVTFAGIASGSGSGMDQSSAGDHSAVTFSGALSAPGSGSSLQSGPSLTVSDLRGPPPPPPPEPTDPNPTDRVRTDSFGSVSSHRTSSPGTRDRVRARDSDLESVKEKRKAKGEDRGRDRSRSRSRDRSREEETTKASKRVRRRRSSSSSRERDRKKPKKSRNRRRSRSPSSSSGSSGSGSESSHGRKYKKKKKSERRSRER